MYVGLGEMIEKIVGVLYIILILNKKFQIIKLPDFNFCANIYLKIKE